MQNWNSRARRHESNLRLEFFGWPGERQEISGKIISNIASYGRRNYGWRSMLSKLRQVAEIVGTHAALLKAQLERKRQLQFPARQPMKVKFNHL